MLDLKWVPATGAAVISKKLWDQLSAGGRDALRTASEAAGTKIRERARQEDLESIAAMKGRGLTVHPVSAELEADWRRMAEGAYPKLRGTMVPADMFDQVRSIIADYRKQHAK
jgi:TRAP-type C4-dicarboxylate transport system substrate-binding protein